MPTLISVLEKNSYMSYREKWKLSNDINVTVFYEETSANIIFKSETGDVTDQIYAILKADSRFQKMKLLTSATYLLDIEQDLVQVLLIAAEKIDAKHLDEGNTY